MKAAPCPCLCPAHFWLLGSCFMAEGPGARALGKGPLLSIQRLRAQYRDLRQQQRAQAHCVVLPKGGSAPAPAGSLVSAVWINKERPHALPQDEGDPEATAMLEEAPGGYLPGSPWHAHLQMHCSVQACQRDPNHGVEPPGLFPGPEPGLPQERDSGRLESQQATRPETAAPEAAQHEGGEDSPHTEAAAGSGLPNGLPCPPPAKTRQRPGKEVHYPFPQRKAPRISQAARNLGLYGPP